MALGACRIRMEPRWSLAVVACLLLAGCADADEEEGPPADPPRTAQAPPPVMWSEGTPTTVSESGTLGPAVCVPSPLGGCGGLSGGASHQIDLSADGANITLELAWTGTTPLDEVLVLRAGMYYSCGDGCIAMDETIRVQGNSPLTLDGMVDADRGDEIGVWIIVDRPFLPVPVAAQATTVATYTLEGTLTPLTRVSADA